MIRTELYEKLVEVLKKNVPEVKHIDLWNRNVEFIDEEMPWERPAVFVEFGPIEWTPLTMRSLRGTGKVRIHLVVDWTDDKMLESFIASTKIIQTLQDLSGDGFDGFELVETQTNHNHEELVESIEVFSVRYLRNL
jgi:hypothetical protein